MTRPMPLFSPLNSKLLLTSLSFATETLAGDGQTEVSTGDLIDLIAADDALSALLAGGINVSEVPDINYAYLDTKLISILASGGGPVYFRLQDDGSGDYSLDHTNLTAAEAAVLSPPYSGSVRLIHLVFHCHPDPMLPLHQVL